MAMNKEKACHIKNHTFGGKLTASDRKAIPADWIFKLKHRGGPIDINKLEDKQFKARVVIRGQFMKEGIDYNDTFAPVCKQATIRALLAYAAKWGCLLKSGDIETAFLTATMDCEVYVKLPPFWGDEDGPITDVNEQATPRVLLRGIPGIPQGSRLFFQTFTAHLIEMGYVPSVADCCLFTNPNLHERNAVILWVDDFVHMHEKEATFDIFMKGLTRKFVVPNVSALSTFLGIEIDYKPPNRCISLSQRNTITVLLERAKMADCNSVSTPCPPGFVFTKTDCPPVAEEAKIAEYRSLIALANFIACWTRPDIAFTVNKLCKFMNNAGEAHWKVLKHLFRYLKGTLNLKLTYDFTKPSRREGLHGFTDSSFADCTDTGRSTLAYVFFYYNAILSWYSKLNTFVTTSTNHSEYAAMAIGAKEAEWQKLLFSTLDSKACFNPIPILVDNSGIASIALNPVDHQANKSIRVNCHYVRELVSKGDIIPVKIASEDNIADMFTKPLAAPTFRKLSAQIFADATTYTTLMFTIKTEPDSFQRDWPYASVLKKELAADYFETIETPEFFSTGRRKYKCIFFKLDGNKQPVQISTHSAMRLVSKKNHAYIVCNRIPIQPLATCEQCGQQQTTARARIICDTCVVCTSKQKAAQTDVQPSPELKEF
jgi:histone deacetylase 1/2